MATRGNGAQEQAATERPSMAKEETRPSAKPLERGRAKGRRLQRTRSRRRRLPGVACGCGRHCRCRGIRKRREWPARVARRCGHGPVAETTPETGSWEANNGVARSAGQGNARGWGGAAQEHGTRGSTRKRMRGHAGKRNRGARPMAMGSQEEEIRPISFSFFYTRRLISLYAFVWQCEHW